LVGVEVDLDWVWQLFDVAEADGPRGTGDDVGIGQVNGCAIVMRE
jgi:hypothetical protein